ncbi:DASH complex subunit SPC19 [Neolecta irregularis DAH-3]|uniref:DASH complex subunit SPC19 n=1 Tax=Neolecta irregularis (strain DAH-3) TaxID=1198029 RepID=A0A1U7LJ27_NEOID|nr:DASH complex subunit SPC19 [Neolecta irregularis DAH-3]|eukprot:OLL22660.1 DASH complex subunit SPC19 [Neolecta irregularis DAH-3]
MDNPVSHSLSGCVSSLTASVQTMAVALDTLHQGICDFPRLASVLACNRHFELVAKSDIFAAQHAIAAEVAPQVHELLKRAEAALAKLERRKNALQSKADLQSVRLQQKPHKSRPSTTPTTGPESSSSANPDKLKALKMKKDRLAYSLHRLTLEADQKHRKLRMSTAFPAVRS